MRDSVAVPMPPAELKRHMRDVDAVFDLLGQDENDLTAALGFTLARSRRLLEALLGELGVVGTQTATVQMEVRDDQGRTDLQVATDTQLLVFEAKRGWQLPSVTQLARYASRIGPRGRGALVTLSDCSATWATHHQPEVVAGVPVRHLPWSQVQQLLADCRASAGGAERVWLTELETYLRKAIRVVAPNDMRTYCVVLSEDRPGGGGSHTFRQYVEDLGVYFHPFGVAGWPRTAPTLFAFRWRGKVQRIHRVAHYEVIDGLQLRWPDIPVIPDTVRAHAVHELGPPLRFEPLPNGRIYANARQWVLLDQLYSCRTLAEAVAASRELDPDR